MRSALSIPSSMTISSSGPRPLASHAPHDGHDECLAVAERIASGRWTDTDRFKADMRKPTPVGEVWCTGQPETCPGCKKTWMATAILLLPDYDEVAAWRSYCATNPH